MLLAPGSSETRIIECPRVLKPEKRSDDPISSLDEGGRPEAILGTKAPC